VCQKVYINGHSNELVEVYSTGSVLLVSENTSLIVSDSSLLDIDRVQYGNLELGSEKNETGD
jgi:hypothetical protein